MKYIRPKTNKKKVTFTLSQRTLDILAAYSKYTQYPEDEIVDIFLENLTTDKRFIEWTQKQRNRKKLDALLQDVEVDDSLIGDSNDEADETNSY